MTRLETLEYRGQIFRNPGLQSDALPVRIDPSKILFDSVLVKEQIVL